MQINYLGHSCFKIKTKKTIIVTDPYDDYIGLRMPQTRADIVTISHEHSDHNCLKYINGNPFIVRSPGEYEIKEVSIFGINSFHDNQNGELRGINTIYVLEIEDVFLCHLGDLGTPLTERQLEEIGDIDILMVPVGGIYTIGPKQALQVINQIEPKIVIPMHYNNPKLNQKDFGQCSSLKDFLQEIGVSISEAKENLVVNKTSLPEEREIISLQIK